MPPPARVGQIPSRPRVLVVDDVPEICHLFESALRRVRPLNVELVTESVARRAIERVRNEKFDVVISDYRMQDADGVSVLTESRATNPGGIRVLMTGYNEIPTSASRLREAGIDAYLQKPLVVQELVLMVIGFLQRGETFLRDSQRLAREFEMNAAASEAIS